MGLARIATIASIAGSFCLGAATAGCESDPSANRATDAGGAIECKAQNDLLEFAYANKACAAAADCVWKPTCLEDSDGCGDGTFGFYLSTAHDATAYDTLESAAQSCGPGECFSCGLQTNVAPATCCMAAVGPIGAARSKRFATSASRRSGAIHSAQRVPASPDSAPAWRIPRV